MASERSELSADHRLHSLSWLFLIAQTAKSLLIPLIFVVFASGGRGPGDWTQYVGIPWLGGLQFYALLLLVPAAITAAVKQAIFRYGFGPEELVVRDGLLTRNERNIPYGRIQNVDLVRNPFHRWLGVAQVRIETASGTKPEAVMRVLSMDAVETLRSHVFAERREAAAGLPESAPERADHVLLAMPISDVVRFGLVDNRGMVVAGAFIGLLWQLGVLDEDSRFDFDPEAVPDWLMPGEGMASWVGPLLVALGLFAAAFVLLRLLSVGLALFRLHHFTVRRQGEDLRTEFGLFTRITATIPRPRIQLLSIKESWLMRRFGRVSVQVETAGAAVGGEDGEDGGGKLPKTRWIAPLLPRERVPALLGETLPALAWGDLEWHPLSARAEGRLRKRSLTVAVLGSVPFYLANVVLGVVATVLFAVWAWFHARWWVRHTAWATDGRTVAYRSGWWRRKLSVVPFGKMQTVERKTSPFDRRRDMSRLAVDTAGAGRAGHRVAIPYLDDEVALALRDRLYYEAAETAYRW
jgi:putative membrane protein